MNQTNINTVNSPESLDRVTELHDQTVIKLEQYFNPMYNTKNQQGEIDFNLIKHYCAYNIGINYNRVNALVLQAENHLSDLETQLAEAMVKAIDDTKKGSQIRGYEVSSTEAKTLHEGHPLVIKYTRAIYKQKNLIGYLKRQLDLLKYFPSNVKTLKEMYETHLQYGSAR